MTDVTTRDNDGDIHRGLSGEPAINVVVDGATNTSITNVTTAELADVVADYATNGNWIDDKDKVYYDTDKKISYTIRSVDGVWGAYPEPTADAEGNIRVTVRPPPATSGTTAEMVADALAINTAGTQVANQDKRFTVTDEDDRVYSFRYVAGVWNYYPTNIVNQNGDIPIASKSDWRGNYPNTWYLSGTATTEAADAFYTSSDVSMYNHFEMNVTVIDSGNVTVSVSIDGTTYADLILFDRSTEALFAAAAITATGTYYFDGKFKNVKVTSSAADTHTIVYAHSVI